MAERHIWSNDDFELRVNVTDDGDVDLSFHESGKCVFSCDWDTFRDVMEFVGVHGLAMREPHFFDKQNPRDCVGAGLRGMA